MKKDSIVQKWYNSGYDITTLIIATILIIIVCSQSYAIGGSNSLAFFGSIINHNSIYLLVLIYFIFVKVPFGKRYFNYFSVFLAFIYFLATFTSLLTVVQAFSLNTMLTFTLNFVLLMYLIHTLFRDTRIWKEFSLNKSPFNELSNDWFFYAIIVLSIFLLAVDLISTVVVSGVIISCLDTVYIILLGRYIYLYREYLDKKKINVDNEGSFEEVREVVSEKVQDVLDKTDIDEKIIETSKEIVKKVEDFIEEKDDKKEVEKKKTTKKRVTKNVSKKKGDKE